MKKLISVLLALLMISLLSVAAFAVEEKSVTFTFEPVYSISSENGDITLTAVDYFDKDKDTRGWYVGWKFPLTLSAAEGLTITRVEVIPSIYAVYFDWVSVSDGNKVPGNRAIGQVAALENINWPEVSFTGGDAWFRVDKVTVYYTSEHVHNYKNNGICSCNRPICADTGEHEFESTCKFCGHTEKMIGDQTASTLSEGNMTVALCVACAAAGFLAAMFIFRKKNPVAAKKDE